MDSTPPGEPPRLTRRQALRLLGAGLVMGACTTGNRTARRAATAPSTTSTTTTTSTTRPSPTSSTSTATTTVPAQPATTSASTTAPESVTTSTTQSLEPPTAADPTAGAPLAGFVAFGDFGGGLAQGLVAQAMVRWAAAHRVDALVTTGDNVYDFGEPRFFDAQLTQPYRDLRAGYRPMWATLGNHDIVSGYGPAQLAYLGLPPLPYAAALPGVRILVLDGNRPDGEQTRWLDEQLTRPGRPFSVVVFHGPVYSCSLHGPTPEIVANWKPVLEAHKVPLVLNGHDHTYNRFLSPGGVNYIVTGGGGRELYAQTPGCQPPELQRSAIRHHFMGVEIYADRMIVTAVASDDVVLDRLEIPALVPAPGG